MCVGVCVCVCVDNLTFQTDGYKNDSPQTRKRGVVSRFEIRIETEKYRREKGETRGYTSNLIISFV